MTLISQKPDTLTRGPGAESMLVLRTAYHGRRAPSDELSAALLGAELTELTRTELVIVIPLPRQLCLPMEVFGDLRARKVEVRVLYTETSEPLADPVATLARCGIALPTPQRLPYFLVVRDREVVYLPHPDPARAGADRLTRLRSVVVGRSVATAFTAVWQGARERARAAQVAAGGHGNGGDLLHVLSDGLTDDQAAARLHMSRRTFARRVSDMMQRLGANTRFQAGVRAARRGWV